MSLKVFKYCLLSIISLLLCSCEHSSPLQDCSCDILDVVVDKKAFKIIDKEKIETVKRGLSKLELIADDGREIFGDTVIFKCRNSQEVLVAINSDYIKIDGVKFRPNMLLSYKLQGYEGDNYVNVTMVDALLKKDTITSLSLRNCNLKAIPIEVFELHKLKELDVGLNLIEEIPDEIGELLNLEELSASYNLIADVSPEISKLQNLQTLWLLDNELSILPEGLCELNRLKELNLTVNHFKELPDCLPHMDSIRFIGIGGNDSISLSQLDEFRKINKSLEVLN